MNVVQPRTDNIRKNENGRPLLFETEEELQKKIDDYFNSCFRPLLDKENKLVKDDKNEIILVQFKPFTICGLAYHLHTNRQTLLNYQNKERYFDIVMRAKERCEQYAEEMLFNRDSARGAQFVLNTSYKNWIEKREIETKNENITTVKQQIDITKLSNEDVIKLSELYKRAAIEQNIIEDAQIVEETTCTEAIASDSQNRENVPE